jgi:ribose/xylose/arabinose/galactoside ABC-type transport system permease subunit
MSSAENPIARPARRQLGFQEGGLVLVVLMLGAFLTFFGGTVRVPELKVNAQGEVERVFRELPNGERELVLQEKNKFLNVDSLSQLAKDTSFIAIMAVGATLVIIAGGIDLSVGAIYALASVTAALFLHQYGPDGARAEMSAWFSVPMGILVCVGVGTICGFLNGGMIVALRVHPFIITLGTMAIYRGIAFVITKGQSVGAFPESFREVLLFSFRTRLSLVPLLVMLLVMVAGGIFLSRMAAGRRVYAVGGNEVASRYSGIRVERVKLGVFILSGFAAGLSALLAIGYYGAATSGDGTGYELNVIAAAVVGGASLSGGKGSALGAVLGALIIQMINTGIVYLGIDQNYSNIIIGTVVIVAVLLDQLNNAWTKRRMAAKAGS